MDKKVRHICIDCSKNQREENHNRLLDANKDLTAYLRHESVFSNALGAICEGLITNGCKKARIAGIKKTEIMDECPVIVQAELIEELTRTE